MKFKQFLTVLALTFLFSGISQAEFLATGESAVFDPVSRNVTFSLNFSQAPDFFTLDSAGRPANDFQYFIVGDSNLGYPAEFDSIIRGGEIYLGQGIPIRNARPAVSDPVAGGWGGVRGRTSFTVTGTSLMFSVPLSVLSDHSTDGRFDYVLQVDSFGALTQRLTGQSIVVLPEPSAAPVLAALGLSFVLFRRRSLRS